MGGKLESEPKIVETAQPVSFFIRNPHPPLPVDA